MRYNLDCTPWLPPSVSSAYRILLNLSVARPWFLGVSGYPCVTIDPGVARFGGAIVFMTDLLVFLVGGVVEVEERMGPFC